MYYDSCWLSQIKESVSLEQPHREDKCNTGRNRWKSEFLTGVSASMPVSVACSHRLKAKTQADLKQDQQRPFRGGSFATPWVRYRRIRMQKKKTPTSLHKQCSGGTLAERAGGNPFAIHQRRKKPADTRPQARKTIHKKSARPQKNSQNHKTTQTNQRPSCGSAVFVLESSVCVLGYLFVFSCFPYD